MQVGLDIGNCKECGGMTVRCTSVPFLSIVRNSLTRVTMHKIANTKIEVFASRCIEDTKPNHGPKGDKLGNRREILQVIGLVADPIVDVVSLQMARP